MCGIVGLWGENTPMPVHRMMSRLTHRGPDGSGVHQSDRAVLGHRRLAIMDPESGQQPLTNETGMTTLVANGEIYNWHSLRTGLDQEHQFRTQSDSEVVLHLFEEQDTDAMAALDGMFALALTDGARLVLARDPIGIKPLYYGQRRGEDSASLVFASEMKAMTAWADEIQALPPGSYYDSETGLHTYYQVPRQSPSVLSLEDALHQVRATLERAVVKRLMSDVPLGAFLSGGLDSSLIAAIARRHMDELHTFSVGIEGSSDLAAARVVADHIGSIHHEHQFTVQEMEEHLPKIVYHLESFDQDLVRSAVPTFFCSRLAAQHVKVILTGEGADELFAGYTYYKDIDDPEQLHRELRRSITSLHNVNLQRVDRMTMAHGLEGRVPFLDTEMIDLGLRLPPEWKLHRAPSGRLIEKWILRQACADLLPEEIVWRDKAQFDEGSGTVDVLPELAASWSGELDVQAYRSRHPQAELRSAEECCYHHLFLQQHQRAELMLPNVGRWAQREA